MEDFWILWIWGFCGDSHRFFCGYGMGMGIKIPSPRQPCKFDIQWLVRAFWTPTFALFHWHILTLCNCDCSSVVMTGSSTDSSGSMFSWSKLSAAVEGNGTTTSTGSCDTWHWDSTVTGGDSSAVDCGTTGDGELSSTASSPDSTVISSSSSSSVDGATTGDGY